METVNPNTTQSQGRYRGWLLMVVVLLTAGCATSPQTNSGAPSPNVIKQTPRPGPGFPQTENFYPLESKKLGETGGPIVRACLDEKGVLTAPVELVKTSGSARLDQAGVALATAGSGRYRPATENGKPVPACFAYRINFGIPIKNCEPPCEHIPP
ncbi:MAG: Protein containing TonB [Gammaproteobacteria bacterium]|nr:Protein containing TonB [Gammaproteobacteria bacterium]